MDSRIQLLDAQLFRNLIDRARQSPRRRTNHNFHASLDEHANRFLNVMLQGTYITPHRHLSPPKPEGFVVLDGRVAVFIFDDTGRVVNSYVLGGGGAMGIDLPAGVWHTFAAVSPHAVCYEVKPGPYSALDDKEFAPWAPREGQPGTADYLAGLLSQLQPA
jgi:cupin fold WbuC family metalloprotein